MQTSSIPAALLFVGGVLFFSTTFTAAAEKVPEVILMEELTALSSGSADVGGVNRVQDKIAEKLKSLGFTVELLENPNGADKSGKLLVATISGESSRYITLVGHADTVFEKLNPFVISEDGKMIKGSGVSDDKGGVVVGLSALGRFLKSHPKLRYSIRFLVTPSEETGSKGFGEHLKKFSADSALIVGLEPARENGSFILSRKGARWYEIRIEGKEAHAGVDHESGINACHELAIKLDQIQKLTDYKKGNTVSIGHIEGGKDKFNIVCGSAIGKVDVRFSDQEEAQKIFKKIDAILKKPVVRSYKTRETAKVSVSNPVDIPPFSVSKNAQPFLREYSRLVERAEGRSIHGEATGGAADVNTMAREGVVILDGMGPVGGGYHTSDEFILTTTLLTRAEALSGLIAFAQKTFN